MSVRAKSNDEKVALRTSLLKTRQSLAVEIWQAKSDQICDRLRLAPIFVQAQTVLAYFSIRQEPDLSALFGTAFGTTKTWGFPRCVEKSLIWHIWSPQNGLPLQTGAFGIQEPAPNAPLLTPEQVDLILVPAVACDEQGYRLGYGGGFYDRLLSTPAWAEKPTIGIVFDFARLPQLPVDEWDYPLKAVCTETNLWMN